MGYKPPRTTYKLNFAQTRHAGLEVEAVATSIQGLADITGMAEELEELDPEKLSGKELKDLLLTLFAPFAKVLRSWNVEGDDGEPLPATLDGLVQQEMPFVQDLIAAYVQAMTEAPPPLPGGSTGGLPPAGLGLGKASQSLPS